MREYGRHIQKMIEYLMTIEDPERRQRNAYAVIELMGFLNPHLKNVEDFRHKLWDHLFLISDFKLDVESPYPIPTKETLKAKPERLKYPKGYPRYAHLGKNIEVIINKALAEENPEKRAGFAQTVIYYMKLVYNNWHKENVHDDTVKNELAIITKGELELSSAPAVKVPPFRQQNEGRGNYDFRNKRSQKFQQRGGGGNREGRDNRNGNGNNRNNGGNNKYNKKRFK